MGQKDQPMAEPVWRFYLDDEFGWRWQRLRGDMTVIAESEIGWGNFENCLEDAKKQGYEFQPAQTAVPRGSTHRPWW